MISKIIEKEKQRQKIIIRDHTAFLGDSPEDPQPFQYSTPQKTTHKQSLINLKEYLEDVNITREYLLVMSPNNEEIINNKKQVEEDIEELNKMIEAYG